MVNQKYIARCGMQFSGHFKLTDARQRIASLAVWQPVSCIFLTSTSATATKTINIMAPHDNLSHSFSRADSRRTPANPRPLQRKHKFIIFFRNWSKIQKLFSESKLLLEIVFNELQVINSYQTKNVMESPRSNQSFQNDWKKRKLSNFYKSILFPFFEFRQKAKLIHSWKNFVALLLSEDVG